MNRENYGIIETVSFNRFCDSFNGSYENNFTYEGKRALYDYLEQYAQDLSENIELDPVALCCEYTEYNNFEEFKKDYNNIETMEELENNTTVIPVNKVGYNVIKKTDGFIILQF